MGAGGTITTPGGKFVPGVGGKASTAVGRLAIPPGGTNSRTGELKVIIDCRPVLGSVVRIAMATRSVPTLTYRADEGSGVIDGGGEARLTKIRAISGADAPACCAT